MLVAVCACAHAYTHTASTKDRGIWAGKSFNRQKMFSILSKNVSCSVPKTVKLYIRVSGPSLGLAKQNTLSL